ncbi:MAG: WhiB family transcriptional regulator [Rhodococcus sp. (in: high G+C Gram-positive bacteria)]
MSDQVGGLLSVLASSPDLPGAACVKTPRLFDWLLDDDEDEPRTVRAERHRTAKEICASCPALEACREWASTLAEAEVLGVVAGELRRTRYAATKIRVPKAVPA